jgi:hypothetical protein
MRPKLTAKRLEQGQADEAQLQGVQAQGCRRAIDATFDAYSLAARVRYHLTRGPSLELLPSAERNKR